MKNSISFFGKVNQKGKVEHNGDGFNLLWVESMKMYACIVYMNVYSGCIV